MRLLIKNAHVIDPIDAISGSTDILIENGRIDKLGKGLCEDGCEIIDAGGLSVAPSFIDIHCHLRDPGFTYKEDIDSGCASAAAGGYTAVCCMPNTKPVLDNEDELKYVTTKAQGSGVSVMPIAAATLNLEGGLLTDYDMLKKAGAVAVSDDGRPITNNALMKAALISGKAAGLKVISHCEMLDLTEGGSVNEGKVSAMLSVGGIPNSAEDLMIARDIILAEEADAPVHIAHVSTKGGIRLIRYAKKRGIRVTCETCPHYFALTEDAVLQKGTEAKMSPPLRTEEDRLAVIQGIVDGTIDAIATDHAPHSSEEKAQSLQNAPNGIVGFESAFSLGITELVRPGHISLAKLIHLMTEGPARCIGFDKKGLSEGNRADLVIFDTSEAYIFDASRLKSKSKNTPFDGMQLYGKIKYTLSEGKIIYSER